MKKSVWMINHFATSPEAPGGTRHYDFGVELLKRGYDVTIFASNLNYMLRANRVRKSLDQSEVRFVRIKSMKYTKNDWRRIGNMLSFALNTMITGASMKSPDVIIGSSPHLFAALSAYFLARMKGSRFFLEVRDLWPQTLVDMGNATEKSFTVIILRKIESLLYRRAEKIIVLSKGAGKYIADRGIDASKIVLIPNGVYLEKFEVTESRDSVRERLEVGNRFVVMYTGAHGPANALDTVIRAAEMCPEAVFVLVGDGPSKAELERMVDEMGLGNVRMLPAVPKKSVPNLLNAADALVITLRSVNLFSYGVSPNKLFEYMASGKPILCAVSGDVADMVKRASAGVVVEPENPEALAQAAISLMSDGGRCSAYGESGKKYVEENFSRSRMVEKLVSVLNTPPFGKGAGGIFR